MKILIGHVSPETAYVVDNYPYGFRLRCKIRFWLDYKPNHGVRLISQTTNPKRPSEVWNKPKASTYAFLGGCMYLNDEGHVTWMELDQYCDAEEAQNFLDNYGPGVPEPAMDLLKRWVAAKVAYDANRNQGDPVNVGIIEARKTFFEAN
jgi:hypothetical protein